MDYKKIDEIAAKLEKKHIPEVAKGNEDSREILTIIQAYRIACEVIKDLNDKLK